MAQSVGEKHGGNRNPPNQWKPGQSGNPNGRPKKDVCITSIVKDILDKPANLPPGAPKFLEGCTWAELIAYNMVIETAKINPPILRELLDRIEGKVKTPIEATGKDGAPLVAVFDPAELLKKLTAMVEKK